MRTILAIARKDAIDILLNKTTLFLVLLPIFMAILFAVLGILLGGDKTTGVLIYDPEHTGIDRVASSIFSNPILTYASTADEVSTTFGPDGSSKDTNYGLGLIVPPNFDNSLRQGNHPQVTLYLNGSRTGPQDRQLEVQLLTNYANNIVNPQSRVSLSIATVNPGAVRSPFNLNQMYTVMIVLTSLIIGTVFIPNLMIEEREKKTIRMLMVLPLSFRDIIIGKALVGAVYQFPLTLIVIAIMRGFTGNIPLLLLFVLIGTCFVVAAGLLIGSYFKTVSAMNAFSGVTIVLLIIPGLFVELGTLITSNPFIQVVKIIPTYFLAEGVNNALQNQATLESTILEVGAVLGSTAVLLIIAIWLLRKQAAIAATL